MNQIRDNIWLSGANYTTEQLVENKITAILNVAFDVNDNFQTDMPPEVLSHVKVGLGDYALNKPYMKELAVMALKLMLMNRETVLVHCAAGVSRSVWVLCKALGDLEGKNPRQILEEVQEKRPAALYGPLF